MNQAPLANATNANVVIHYYAVPDPDDQLLNTSSIRSGTIYSCNVIPYWVCTDVRFFDLDSDIGVVEFRIGFLNPLGVGALILLRLGDLHLTAPRS